MQATHAGNQMRWKQAFKDAILELDPICHRSKLEAAQKAVEDRLLEVRSGGTDSRELMELEDAKRILLFLGDLFLGSHEQQT